MLKKVFTYSSYLYVAAFEAGFPTPLWGKKFLFLKTRVYFHLAISRDMRRIAGVSQADENIDEANETLLMMSSSGRRSGRAASSSSSTASASSSSGGSKSGRGRGNPTKKVGAVVLPSSRQARRKGCCSKQAIATQSTMDEVLPHVVEREPVIVEIDDKSNEIGEDASEKAFASTKEEREEDQISPSSSSVLIDIDGNDVEAEEKEDDVDDDSRSVSTLSSTSSAESLLTAKSVAGEEEEKKGEVAIDIEVDDDENDVRTDNSDDEDDDDNDRAEGEDDIESGRRRSRRRKSELAEVSDDSMSSGSLSSKSSAKKKSKKGKSKEEKKKSMKLSSSSTKIEKEMNERQPLLSKNSEEEKKKEEEEKSKKSTSGAGFAKTCKTIGAFSALTMTAAVCFIGYQVYPVVNDDLSLGNIAQHLKSYLLVDLPNGNLKPVLPDESDLLPIDADGNFILPGGKNETASSSVLPVTSSKKTSKSSSSSLEPSEEDAEDTHPDILEEAVIGRKEIEEDADADADTDGEEDQLEKKSTFGGFLRSKAKEDEQSSASTVEDASDDSEQGSKEDLDEKADDEQEEEQEGEEKNDDQTDKESKDSEVSTEEEQQEDSSANYSGKELEKGSISSGYARSKERYAEAVKNFKSGKMSTSGKMYELGPSETPKDVEEGEGEVSEEEKEEEEVKVDELEGASSPEDDKPTTTSSVIPKVDAVAKIVDKTKDIVSSALETIDHLEKGTEEAPKETEEEGKEEENENENEEETRANSDDMPSLEGISTSSVEKRINEDRSNASKASAEADKIVAAKVAASADDVTNTSDAAETTTNLSSPKIIVSKACETSEDETALGLYRQVNSQCESTADGNKPIGCIPQTKNCQGCYLSDTPAASQKDSLTQCASVVCDFHDVQGCKS